MIHPQAALEQLYQTFCANASETSCLLPRVDSSKICLNLHLPHLQLDELRTRLRCATQVLWLAIDARTKILPELQLGPRTKYMAHLVIRSL
jgi:hypothetical protein